MKSLKTLSKEIGAKFPAMMKDLRIVITGKSDGPPITELINILGPGTVIKRLRNYLL